MKPASSTVASILAPILVLGLGMALAGCAQLGIPDPTASSPATLPALTPAEIEWARKSGTNTVSGLASQTVGGTTHTCAGQSANLVPDSAYARARMTAIFGNPTRGTRAASLGPAKFDRDDPLYVSTLRTTRCDAGGSFTFPRVPDGVWYVTTSIKWQAVTIVPVAAAAGGQAHSGEIEGGSMMQRVDVRGGRLVKVVLP